MHSPDERYGLTWPGKRRARQLALTPSTATLRPCPNDSIDWETTRNLMLEGDNLEVLKLLQKSYAGSVKLIYIDPPYNTGNDFVYPDDFTNGIRNYLELTGQRQGGATISSNPESSGRFHTDWLNMMYARLRAAQPLLAPDGVMFISIDDTEVANLRLLCDELFGPENFVAQVVWEGANKNDARQIGIVHEYVLVYARSRGQLEREWSVKKEGVDEVLAEVERLRTVHGVDYDAASEELAGWFRAMKAKPVFGLRRFRFIDARGVYKEDDPTAPGGRRFELRDPGTGHVLPLRRNRGWSFDQAEFDRLVADGRISFISDTGIMVRRYLHETSRITPPSVLYQPARSASERLTSLMGDSVFDFPKDETILAKFVEMATPVDGNGREVIVLDFFAGSGATAHAVMAQNASDGGNRRYILVQLPEPLSLDRKGQSTAARYCQSHDKPLTIAELTKERLRRSAARIKADNPAFSGDLGFRVFRLDSSNLRDWDGDAENLEQRLLDYQQHVKPDRSDHDVLNELLLKLGLDLCVPIASRQVAGKTVHAVGGGVLIACLDDHIDRADVEPVAHGMVAWRVELSPAGETTCIFKDSAFADDVTKTNMASILAQHGLTNVRSL